MTQMEQKELTELSDQELSEKRKKSKAANITNAVIFGVLIGIATYSTVRNGFGLLTFIPLVFAPIATNHSRNHKSLEKELKSRNLN